MTDVTEQPNDTEGAKPENKRAGSSGKAAGRRGQFTKGNAPKGKPFPKGVSGNPAGTSKTKAEMQKIFLDYCPEAAETVVHIMRHDRSAKNRLAASTLVFEYGIGKPRQQLEISTDPVNPPNFGISFVDGGPGNPVDAGIEVSGDVELSSDNDPLELPYQAPVQAVLSSALAVPAPEVEAPRLPPDPAHPTAVTIDRDGTIWKQLDPEPPETRAEVAARRQEALDRRRREGRERVEEENARARESARIRKMRESGEL